MSKWAWRQLDRAAIEKEFSAAQLITLREICEAEPWPFESWVESPKIGRCFVEFAVRLCIARLIREGHTISRAELETAYMLGVNHDTLRTSIKRTNRSRNTGS